MTKDRAKRGLQATANRLVTFLELNAPNVIVANEVMLLLKRAFVAFPNEMSDAFGKSTLNSVRASMGVCLNCGEADAQVDGLCTECDKKEKDESEEIDRQIDEYDKEFPEEN